MPDSLTLKGTVHDIGAATSGTVRVRVGNAVVTSTVTLPDYVVEVGGARADAMVTIWVEGAGFRHVALAGSFAKLTRMAGADHVLTLDESLGRLRLSAFDTALTHFVLRTLGHAPATDGAHEQALRSVQSNDLAIATSALKALARQDVALPAGYADGLALLQDQQAFTAFATQNRQLLDRQQYLADAASVAFPSDHLGDRLILLDAVRRDQGAMVYPSTQVVEKTPSGYLVNAWSSRADASFVSERLPSGDVRLHPNSIIETSIYYGLELGWEHRRLGMETYRRMFVGETASLWMVVTEEFITYTGSAAPPSHWSASSRFWTVSSPALASPRLDRSLSGQQIPLPVFCSRLSEVLEVPYALPCEYAMHAFDASGTGHTSGMGSKVDGYLQPVTPSGSEAFDWSFDNRRALQLDYADARVTYWPIGFGDEATSGFAYVATVDHPGGPMTLAGYTAMLRPGIEEPSGTSVLGDWRYATFVPLLPYVQRPGTYSSHLISRYADGAMLRTATRELAGPLYFRSHWKLMAGRLYNTSFYSDAATPPSTFGHSSCEQADAEGATICGIESVRYFEPVARKGNRIYGIEDVYLNPQHLALPISEPYQLIRASRLTYYEKL